MDADKDLQEIIDKAQRLRDSIEIPREGVAQQQIWLGEELEIHLLAFAEGAEYEGSFAGEIIYFVLKGHVRFRFPKESKHIRMGELIIVPRNTDVHAQAEKPSKLMAIVAHRDSRRSQRL